MVMPRRSSCSCCWSQFSFWGGRYPCMRTPRFYFVWWPLSALHCGTNSEHSRIPTWNGRAVVRSAALVVRRAAAVVRRAAAVVRRAAAVVQRATAVVRRAAAVVRRATAVVWRAAAVKRKRPQWSGSGRSRADSDRTVSDVGTS